MIDKPEDQVGSPDPLDLDTAAERQDYHDDMLLNPDFNKYDNDVLHMNLTDTGNHEAYQDILDQADVHGGKLSRADNGAIARAVDQNFEARDVDDARSKDISASGRINDEEKWSADESLDFTPDLDSLLAENDPDLASERLMQEILQRHPELEDDVYDASMAGDAFAVLSALEEIAHQNGMDDLSQYAQGVNQHAADQGNIRAMDYLNPLIPVVDIAMIDMDERAPAPVVATPTVNDPNLINQQIIQPPGATA